MLLNLNILSSTFLAQHSYKNVGPLPPLKVAPMSRRPAASTTLPDPRRDKSPARAHPKPHPKLEAQPETEQLLPYDVACVLLNLGTAVFPVAVAALNTFPLSAPDTARLLTCLLSYSCVILAFIGGIQQAAAISGSEHAPAMVTWREPPTLIVPVAAIGLALLGWVTLSVAQYRGIAPSDLLVMSCLYAAQACLEATHPLWQQLPPRVLMQQARRLPMLTAALCLAAASRAAARVAPFSLGRADTAYSAAELGLLLLSAVLVAVAIWVPSSPSSPSSSSREPSWSPSYERPEPAKFGHIAVGSTNAAKVAAVRKALRAFPTVAPPDAPVLPFWTLPLPLPLPLPLTLTLPYPYPYPYPYP